MVALRAEMFLDEVFVLTQSAIFLQRIYEGEHLGKMKQAYAVIVLEDRIDVSQ